MSKNQTKKRSAFSDRPIVGLTLLLIINVLFVGLLLLIQRYIKIHPKYFVMGIGIAMVVVLIFNVFGLLGYAKRMRIFRQITVYAGVFIILVSGVTTFYLYRTNTTIDKIIKPSGDEVVEYSVVSFNNAVDETMMDGKNIGFVASSDTTFEQLVKDTIHPYSRSIEYIQYTSDEELLNASLKDEIQFAVLPKSYAHLSDLVEGDVDPLENSKLLFSFTTKVQGTASNVDVVNEPFSILMIGVNDNLSDSLIYATYNPKTLKITMTSIARDSYVPIACRNGALDKINHSRGISRQCLIDTTEDFLDEKIDFYFEADFYALVKIVDALGGLDIDSPASFAGEFPLEGQFHENGKPVMEGVAVPEGLNHLDGKQVLTFARERKHMPNGDFDRQMNQQLVIKEVAAKILATRNPNTLLSVLDGAKDNIETNLPMSSISALMGHAIQSMDSSTLKPAETFRFAQSQIAGEGYQPGKVWYSIPYASQVRNARVLIDQNMLVQPELRGFKGFEFGFTKPYDAINDNDEFEANKGELWYSKSDLPRGETTPEVDEEETPTPAPTVESKISIPDFSGMTNSEIQSWANSNGMNVEFFTKEQTDASKYTDGQFWSQSTAAGSELSKGSTIHITRVKLIEDTSDDSGSDGGSDGGNDGGETDGGNTEPTTP